MAQSTAAGDNLAVVQQMYECFNRIVEVQVYSSDQYAVGNFFWQACNLAPIPGRLG